MKLHRVKASRNAWALLSAMTMLLSTTLVSAGTLDTTLGGSGRVVTDVAFEDHVQQVFAMPDGKVLVAGEGTTFFFGPFASWPILVRYNSNGTLDTSFGNQGKVFGDGGLRVIDVLVQPDGKIVVVGGASFTSPNATNDFGLYRYNSNGTLDTAFGASGRVVTSIGGLNESAGAVILLPDGKLQAAGGTAGDGVTPATIDLVRYNPDGTLDGTFGTGGKIAHSYPASGGVNPLITGLALTQGGKILGRGPGFMARFNADGSFDMSFDGDGIRTDGLFAKYFAVQPDGRYLVAGTSDDVAPGHMWTISRFNSDGSVDNTFGTNGTVLTTFRGFGGVAGALVGRVMIKSSGEIVAVGSVVSQTNLENRRYAMAAANYSASGAAIARTLVPFDPNSSNSTNAFGRGVAVQSDDKILLGANFYDNVGLARLTTITNDFFAAKRNYDFNGDHKDDITTYRLGSGGGPSHWYSSSFPFPWFTFGSSEDLIAPGDYNGDGIAELAVFRPSNGIWYISNSLTNASNDFRTVVWGTAGDVPAAGDFDGDGKFDVAVFRPSTGAWYVRTSETGAMIAVQWGTSGDQPVVGDYDGDGKSDIAVFRPSTGGWYMLKSSNGQMLAYTFGMNGDRPVPADYDGDGTTDVAVFRPSSGAWYLLKSSNGAFAAQSWGQNGDVPAPGDYDGDGKADFAVYRSSGDYGYWYFLKSADGATDVMQWGLAADVPVPGN
jgi:uncharacterized delta-60 repeat protein